MKFNSSVLIALTGLLAGCQGLRTRTDSVHATKIEGTYWISFVSRGRYLAPLTPEGAFPKWSDCSNFQTVGPGEPAPGGGTRFILGKSLESQYGRYGSGELRLQEGSREVQLHAKLSREYRGMMNHSGVYPCQVNRPALVPIQQFQDQESMVGHYVSAVGRFVEDKFVSGPYTFADPQVQFVAGSSGEWNPRQDYRVIGYVERNTAGNGYEIHLFSVVPKR